VAWHDGGVYVWAGTIAVAFEQETAERRTKFERGGGNAKDITTNMSESSRTENAVEAALPPATPSLEGTTKAIGRVTHRFHHRDNYVRNQDLSVLCRAPGQNSRWRAASAKDSSTMDEHGQATQWLPIIINVDGITGEYKITVHYPALTTTWREERTNAPAGGCENPPPSSEAEEGKTSPMSEAFAQSSFSEIRGQVDPKDPDTLSGEKITGDLETGRTTERWNLHRVKPPD
jgi:hypothetical protein